MKKHDLFDEGRESRDEGFVAGCSLSASVAAERALSVHAEGRGGCPVCSLGLCSLFPVCSRRPLLPSRALVRSFYCLLSFSRNKTAFIRSSVHHSVHRDRRRLSPPMVREASSVCEESTGLSCVPCVCFYFAGWRGCARSRRPTAGLPPACSLVCSWLVPGILITQQLQFVPRSIATVVVCPSRASSSVAHDARSKRSGVCGE